MSAKMLSFTHLTGEKAHFILWLTIYNCNIELSAIPSMHQNLEVILSHEGILLAYKYDQPSDEMGTVTKIGQWHHTNHCLTEGGAVQKEVNFIINTLQLINISVN
jgi:hypothetical protein